MNGKNGSAVLVTSNRKIQKFYGKTTIAMTKNDLFLRFRDYYLTFIDDCVDDEFLKNILIKNSML